MLVVDSVPEQPLFATSVEEPLEIPIEGGSPISLRAFGYAASLEELHLVKGSIPGPRSCRSCELLNPLFSAQLIDAQSSRTWSEGSPPDPRLTERLLPDAVRCLGCSIFLEELQPIGNGEGLVVTSAQLDEDHVLCTQASGRLLVVADDSVEPACVAAPAADTFYADGIVYLANYGRYLSSYALSNEDAPCVRTASVALPLEAEVMRMHGAPDGSEIFVIAADGTLVRVRGSETFRYATALRPDDIGKAGIVWMGPGRAAATSGGSQLGLIEGDQVRVLSLEFSGIQTNATSLAFDPNRGLLIGTTDHGVAVADPTPRLVDTALRASERVVAPWHDGFLVLNRNAILRQHVWDHGECEHSHAVRLINEMTFRARGLYRSGNAVVIPELVEEAVGILRPANECPVE